MQIGVALCLTFVSIAADVCLLAQCTNNITAFLTQFLKLDVDWYEGDNLILRGNGVSVCVFFLKEGYSNIKMLIFTKVLLLPNSNNGEQKISLFDPNPFSNFPQKEVHEHIEEGIFVCNSTQFKSLNGEDQTSNTILIQQLFRF